MEWTPLTYRKPGDDHREHRRPEVDDALDGSLFLAIHDNLEWLHDQILEIRKHLGMDELKHDNEKGEGV